MVSFSNACAARVALCAAGIAAFFPHYAAASIYPVEKSMIEFEVFEPIKSMPMFTLDDAPFWLGSTSEPYIQVSGIVDTPLETPVKDSPLLKIVIGWNKLNPNTADLIAHRAFLSDCSSTASQTDILNVFDGVKAFIITQKNFDEKFNISATGWHLTFVTNCQETSTNLNALFEYRNPFGYLTGWAFGILPMNGFLCVLYGILALGYIFKTVQNREHVLRLQYAIIGVIIMGFVERLTWFLTYLEMNSSGGRACCPVRLDLSFSLALAVFKRSSSALLLLAVCLGFGVVKPKLDRSTNIKIIVLGLFYTISSLNLELEKIEDVSTHGRQTDPFYLSSLVVSICDVIILFWIYYAISEILKQLRDAKQLAKLGMYQTLARALAVWVVVWFIFTITEVLVFQGKVNFSWKYWWVLVSFWDLFFFGILTQICYIWLPSELTAQYAFSHQLPTNEDLDEFDHAGLEMQLPDTTNGSEFVIGDDDDDFDDDELSLDGLEASIASQKNKVALD